LNAMHPDASEDVPSPIDLSSVKDARAWAGTAMQQRPWREQILQRIVAELRTIKATPPLRVLELGSGPGFLANARQALACPGLFPGSAVGAQTISVPR